MTKKIDRTGKPTRPWHERPEDKTASELLSVACRALECIYRFTQDTYARDALKEIHAAGWPVDWEGAAKCRRCNDVGCEACM